MHYSHMRYFHPSLHVLRDIYPWEKSELLGSDSASTPSLGRRMENLVERSFTTTMFCAIVGCCSWVGFGLS